MGTKSLQTSAEHQARLNVLPSAALTYAKSLQTSAEHQTRLNVLPSAALTYAKSLQTSAMKVCFQIAECSFDLCKGNAKSW